MWRDVTVRNFIRTFACSKSCAPTLSRAASFATFNCFDGTPTCDGQADTGARHYSVPAWRRAVTARMCVLAAAAVMQAVSRLRAAAHDLTRRHRTVIV